VLELPVTANVLSSLMLFTLMVEPTRSTETSVLKRATRRQIPEDNIFLIHAVQTCSGAYPACSVGAGDKTADA
jgi:hypothetical protein